MEIRRVPIDLINPAPYNPRRDLRPGDPDYEALRRSIEEFGYVDPCIWNEGTGNLVGGHQRFKIMLAQGAREIDCSVVDLDPDRERALNLALNRIAGDWDAEKLAALLGELSTAGVDLTLTGFTEDELSTLLTPAGPGIQEDGFDADAAAAAVAVPVTQPGDLWLLGDHRVLCGDSTCQADMLRLMDGKLAAMMFTDPPYNVAYEGKTARALRMQNDSMPSDRFREFLLAAFRNAAEVTAPGGAVYVCHADSEGVNFRVALVDAGWELKQCLIWVKNQFVLGRQDYQWQHEPILYGWRAGASHRWYGDRKQSTICEADAPLVVTADEGGHLVVTIQAVAGAIVLRVPSYELIHFGTIDKSTVWPFDKPVRNADHPTMKPIGVPARGISNSSKPGEIVLDEFLGGGSTLMAAEQTGRICFGMELDPRYCDVIVHRWEEFTGRRAVVADAGR